MDDRKQNEIYFYNKRENDRLELNDESYQKKYSNKKFYSIDRMIGIYLTEWMRQNCQDKVVLDYCCGLGRTSLDLARYGAFVYGIDISDESIKTATNAAAEADYADKIRFSVMDAENLEFEDEFFDFIVCNGVLHHLDLAKAYPELFRVLKTNGQVICKEALGYNPVIQWYRKRTPHLRTAWEMEHILSLREVKQAKQYFDKIDVKYFHLFSILAVPFRNMFIFKPVLTLLESIDSIVLKIPFVRLLAWQIIFVLSEPKKEELKCESG